MSKRHPAPAPIVDPVLAHVMASARDPIELLAIDQSQAYAVRFIGNAAHKGRYRRLVLLDCGHFTETTNIHNARCPRCGAMQRAGYDYAGYRLLGNHDNFAWPGDPLRELHERL
ncbi:MAG TPA: hypothetical protein VF292_03040 [Rhodanobacteraceae bacterium]